MQKREIAITNRLGLHARASAKIALLASQFRCHFTLACGGRHASARSIVAVMLLAASMGSTIVLEAEGPEEAEAMTAEAMTAMVGLIDARFGENR